MSVNLRIALVVFATIVFLGIIHKLRRSQINVIDSFFWLLFALSFIVLAVFPQIAYYIASMLGFVSPSNCVLLFVIFVLVVHSFSTTIRLNEMNRKLNSLVQDIAIHDNESGSK